MSFCHVNRLILNSQYYHNHWFAIYVKVSILFFYFVDAFVVNKKLTQFNSKSKLNHKKMVLKPQTQTI